MKILAGKELNTDTFQHKTQHSLTWTGSEHWALDLKKLAIASSKELIVDERSATQHFLQIRIFLRQHHNQR